MKRRSRVAVLDSGVHPKHPHVGGVTAGFNATTSGMPEDWLDYLGHGTAVAAAIRSHAPEVELLAVKVFDRKLRTDLAVLERGVEWALGQGADYINLSLGSKNAEHEGKLREWVARGGIWVSAAEVGGERYYPGCLKGVVGVLADATLDRGEFRRLGEGLYQASPYPREIPMVPKEKNLQGISFAVANLTGLLAAGKVGLDRG